MITLYHYVHCPYCVRVRLALSFLNIPYQSKILAYDDENTPVELTGKKMLPIIQDGPLIMNESLDIIKYLDPQNLLNNDISLNHISSLIDKLSPNIHNLCMPYWIYTPEFNNQSRQYFIEKKSKKRGPFHLLAQNRKQFEIPLIDDLNEMAKELSPFYQSENLTIKDIMLAAHLWGLYILPEFRHPEKIHQYLQHIASITSFKYHDDYWRSEI